MSSRTTLFDETEVALRLAISVKTLRNWRWLGFGPPFVKVGRAVRYAAADLEAWIAQRTAMSTAKVLS